MTGGNNSTTSVAFDPHALTGFTYYAEDGKTPSVVGAELDKYIKKKQVNTGLLVGFLSLAAGLLAGALIANRIAARKADERSGVY